MVFMYCGRKIEMGVQPNMQMTSSKESLPTHGVANSSQSESKLELFGFDSLVNILGLKRYECPDFSVTYTYIWPNLCIQLKSLTFSCYTETSFSSKCLIQLPSLYTAKLRVSMS